MQKYDKRILLSGGFTRENHSHCPDRNTYSSYSTLIEAKADCHSNAKCVGVFDLGCDGYNEFNLCKNFFVTTVGFKYIGSCIYKKEEFYGTYWKKWYQQ